MSILKITNVIGKILLIILIILGLIFMNSNSYVSAAALEQTNNCVSSSATCNITMSSTSAGNLIVVSISVLTSATQSYTVTDNQSNTYTTIAEVSDTQNFRRTVIAYAKNTTGGVTSITVSTTGDNFRATAQEFSGMETDDVVDVSGTLDQNSSVSSIDGPSLTTTVSNTVIVAVLGSSQSITGVSSSGWSDDFRNGGSGDFTHGIGVASKINTSAGSYTPTWTRGSSGYGCVSAVAFKVKNSRPSGVPSVNVRSSSNSNGKEYYYAESDSESTTNNTSSFQDKTTLTFTPTPNSTYAIFAAYGISNQNITRTLSQFTNSTQGTIFGSSTVAQQHSSDYFTFGGIGIDSFGSSPSSQTYKIQYMATNASWVAKIQNARIFALKLGENDKYVESLTRATNNTTTYADSASLTFTPPSAGDYLIVASADLDLTAGSPAKVKVLLNSTDYAEAFRFDTSGSNDLINYTQAFEVNLSASSQTIKIQYAVTTSGTVGIRNARIVVLRLSDFVNYRDNFSSTRNTTTNTTYTDIHSLNDVAQQSDYIVFSSNIIDVVNSSSNSASVNLLENSTTKAELVFRSRQTFQTQHQPFFTMYKFSPSSPVSFKNQFKGLTGGTVGIDEKSIVAVGIPSARPVELPAVKIKGGVKFR